MAGRRCHRVLTSATVAAAAALAAGSPAGAAPGPSYGGGLLRTASIPRHYDPSVAITLQPRGGTLALHFETSLVCARESYAVEGAQLAPFANGHASAAGRSVLPLGRGRVVYTWSIAVDVGPDSATGTLTIGGKRRIGRRTQTCTHKPQRPFTTRAAAAPTGEPASPVAGAAYLGLSEMTLGHRLRAPVIVRVSRSGARLAAIWTAKARCRRGPAEFLPNYTPPTSVKADGSFARSERFRQKFSDAVVRYRVAFAGHFTSDGAAGSVRMRARVYDRAGSRLKKTCDSGLRHWTALRADTASPPPPSGAAPPASGGAGDGSGGGSTTTTTTPTAPPERKQINAATWSLQMTSDPGDYIGQGQSYSYTQADGQMLGSGEPSYIGFDAFPGSDTWSGGFRAPDGQTLVVGTTYQTGGAGQASGGVDGQHRACGATGSFTVEQLAFSSPNMLKDAKVSFAQHCEGSTAWLRGTWEFHAP